MNLQQKEKAEYSSHSIDIGSAIYPHKLKDIKNPPKVLYARGNLDLLQREESISVVGTRDASPNGLKITERITQFLVTKGGVIVSGLALGIDRQAHVSCLEFGGKTIAVLAHGLDSIYPPQNKQLAFDILREGGLLVSEHPDGVRPNKSYFVQRNRIQVGLSKISIVIEASVASGTTSHAKFCVGENHPLFAVVPSSENTLGLNYLGPKMMVDKLGAIPITDKNDYKQFDIVFS